MPGRCTDWASTLYVPAVGHCASRLCSLFSGKGSGNDDFYSAVFTVVDVFLLYTRIGYDVVDEFNATKYGKRCLTELGRICKQENFAC